MNGHEQSKGPMMSEQKSRISIMWCFAHDSEAVYDTLGDALDITECETHAIYRGAATPCDLEWGHVVRGLPEVAKLSDDLIKMNVSWPDSNSS